MTDRDEKRIDARPSGGGYEGEGQVLRGAG
jgi:hypothetical protein